MTGLSIDELIAIAGPPGTGADISSSSNTPNFGLSTPSVNPEIEKLKAIAGSPKPVSEPLTFGETLTGGMINLLNKAPLVPGDEIVAGGTSILDDLRGIGGKDGTYQDRLAQVRDLDKRYGEQNPFSSGLNNLVGLVAPIPSFSKAPGVINAAKNIGKAATFGSVLSGGGKFLGNEGGFENRLQGVPEAAGLGAILGTGGQTLIEGISGLGNMASRFGSGVEDSLVGYKPEAKARVAGFLDKFGNKTDVPISGGTQAAKSEESIQGLRDLGFFDRIKSTWTPKQVSNELSVFKHEAGQTIGSVIDDGVNLENKLLNSDSLAPFQKQSYLTKNSPNFSDARQYIDDLKSVDPLAARRLVRKLDSIELTWNKSDQTLSAFKNLQEKFGLINKKSFNPLATAEEQIADVLNNKVYGSLADSLSSRVEALGGSDLASKFKHANKAYSTASTWEQKAFDASRKSGLAKAGNDLFGNINGGARSIAAYLGASIPVIGPLLAGERLLTAATDIAPAQVAKIAGALGRGSQKALSASGGLLGLGSNVVNNNTATSAPLNTSLNQLSSDMKNSKGVEVTSPEFDTKLNKIASNLDINPEHLFKAIGFETGGTFDSKVKNKAGSGATGLIQFMPNTAKDLTKADTKEAAIKILSDMSPTQQLDYVEKYLKPFKGKINSVEDLYMAILYPKAVGKSNSYSLFEEGSRAYFQNKGLDLNQDGVITKAEASDKVKNYKV